jgi:hypothetical protein
MRFFIFSIVILALCLGCKTRNCPINFLLPMRIIPAQLEYRIGDTITIISKFDKKLKGYGTQWDEVGTFDMEGITWQPVSFIYRIDSLESQNNPEFSILSKYFQVLDNPAYDYKPFQFSDGSKALMGEYNYSRDTFSLEYKIIPNKIGIFFLENGSYALHTRQDFPGKCFKEDFWPHIEMNGGQENNIELFKSSPDSHWNTWLIGQSETAFYKAGGYCFKVIP